MASVVVLAWNAGRLVRSAVDSVLGSEGVAAEVVVVDNASTDAASRAELDALERDGVRLLRLPTNTGFACGMNAGYALTTGDPVVPLNVDAVLHPRALATAARVFAERPEVGVIGPHVQKLDPGGPWRYWDDRHAVSGYDGGPIGVSWAGQIQEVSGAGLERPCFKANGACPFLRRAFVEDLIATYGVGPFDPVFDTYGEDVDLSWKAWARGWTTLYRRDVEAGHIRSFASPLERRDKRGRLRVNLVAERYLNAVRHQAAPSATARIAAGLATDSAMVVWQLLRDDPQVVADVARGWGRAVAQAPALLAYRRRHREWRRIDAATRASWR